MIKIANYLKNYYKEVTKINDERQELNGLLKKTKKTKNKKEINDINMHLRSNSEENSKLIRNTVKEIQKKLNAKFPKGVPLGYSLTPGLKINGIPFAINFYSDKDEATLQRKKTHIKKYKMNSIKVDQIIKDIEEN